MPTQMSSSLSLTLATVEFNCQVIGAKLNPPASGKPTLVRTACPATVISEPGDPVPGTLTGEVYTDTLEDGLTDVLLTAKDTDAELAYVLTMWDDDDDAALRWTGTCTVGDLELDFTPGKRARHPLNLDLVTAVRSRPPTTP